MDLEHADKPERPVRVARRTVFVASALGLSATAAWVVVGGIQVQPGRLRVSLTTATPTYAALIVGSGDTMLSLTGLGADFLRADLSEITSVLLRPSAHASLETINGRRTMGTVEHCGPWGGHRGEARMPISIAIRFRSDVLADPASLRKLEWRIDGEVRRGASSIGLSEPVAAILQPDYGLDGSARRTGSWRLA